MLSINCLARQLILDIQHFQVWCIFGNKLTRIKGIPKLTCYPICNVAGIFISILDLRSKSQAGFRHTYGRKQHGPAPMPNRQRMEWKTNEILLVISIKCFVLHRRRPLVVFVVVDFYLWCISFWTKSNNKFIICIHI